MNAFKVFSSYFFIASSMFLIGDATYSNQEGTPALFETKAEAEMAAKKFNCTGAHFMGNKWMPCESHDGHQQNKKVSRNGHHHHHH